MDFVLVICMVDIMDCGEDLIGVKEKFEGGVLGADGCIYCIPWRCRTCVKIVPASPKLSSRGETAG